MLNTGDKPNLKRGPGLKTPTSSKKLKTSEGMLTASEKKFENITSNIKVKSKKHHVKSKMSESGGKPKKFGLKSKQVFSAKNKLSTNQNSTGEKPNWVEIKQEKKQQKIARKEKKHGLEVYELSVKAKGLWEKLRRKSTPAEKKQPLCQELFQLVKRDIEMLIHSHDLARVIQSLIKYGTPDIHTHVANKLCQCFVKAATSKYGRFCIKTALKKSSAEVRSSLVQCVLGNVVKLFCHKFSHSIIDEIYTIWAVAAVRSAMRLEFYGELSKLLTVQTDKKHVLEKVPEDLKPAILAATKLNVFKILDRLHLLKSPLAHVVLADFLSACNPQDKNEVLERVHTEVESLLTSNEGLRVAINILWLGTNKMKKVAVKSVKGKVKELAQSEFGHSFVMDMFDSIDDTVLLNKVIVPEMLTDLDELLKNEYGRRVILYLVAHRDPAYFHPQQLELFKQGDSLRNSKKENKQRLQELLAVVSKDILQKMCTDPALWCRDSSTTMVMLAVLKSAEAGENLDATYKALTDYILDPQSMITVNEDQLHAVETIGVHIAVKKLLIHEKNKALSNQSTFAKCLVSSLTDESLSLLLQSGRGAFTLVFILENGDEETNKTLKSKLSNVIDSVDKSAIKKCKGLQILLSHLNKT